MRQGARGVGAEHATGRGGVRPHCEGGEVAAAWQEVGAAS
jgi:hypothetical protein